MGNKRAGRTKAAAWAVRLIGAAMALTTWMSLSADEIRQQWTFKVYLDDREIGFHDFSVSQVDGVQQVEINARFNVKFLFFNAYRYEHQNLEQWQGDCLADIESQTNDNGDRLKVSGAFVAGGFSVETQSAAEILNSNCVRSFAYWNPAILHSDRLLNSQTGELVDVNVTRAGTDTLSFGDSRFDALKYIIATEEGPISLWYTSGEPRWLALEAPAKGGRTIRYEPVILPFWPAEGDSLAMK